MEAQNNTPGGFLLDGLYENLNQVKSQAPREFRRVAATGNATYCYDGNEWVLLTMKQYINFKVESRHYITGRGYVTVVHNPDLLPIDVNKSAVVKGQFLLPIRGVECVKTLLYPPTIKPDWGLVTAEETEGDWLTIRMHPDEEGRKTVLTKLLC